MIQHCITEFVNKCFTVISSYKPNLTWKPVKGLQTNSADPDQTSHNVAFDQDLHCLLKGFSINKKIQSNKWTCRTYNSGRIHHYTMGYTKRTIKQPEIDPTELFHTEGISGPLTL